MAATEVVASYKKLGLVEEAFRSLKTVQLEVRPVCHKTDDRIRSHVFLCEANIDLSTVVVMLVRVKVDFGSD